MITCPQCGFHNLDGTEACTRCHVDLRVRRVAFDLPSERRGLLSRVLVLTRPFHLLAHHIAGFVRRPPPADLPYRNAALAGWLSLVPGLGQAYNGQWRMGLAYLAVVLALAAAGVALILSPVGDVFFTLAFLVLVHGINQAATEAQHINGSATFFGGRRWLGFFATLFFTGLLMYFLQYFAIAWVLAILLTFGSAAYFASWSGRQERGAAGHLQAAVFLLLWLALVVAMFRGPALMWHSAIRLQYHSQYAFAPLIEKGDRLLIETVSFAWRDIELGDIVFYDPGRYAVEVGRDLHLVNMESNVERVVGLPGDVIERRDGIFYRNGKAALPHHTPLVQDELPFDYAFEVPEDCYAIMMSYGPWEWSIIGDRKAAPPTIAGVGPASIIERKDIFGRVRMIFYPWGRRRFLDRALPMAPGMGGASR